MPEKETVVNFGSIGFYLKDDQTCKFMLKGEMDHHSVKEMREIIDSKIIDYRPMEVELDLSEVTFTDSAGLGLVLGRYTRISSYGGKLKVTHVPHPFMKILRLSGVERFIQIEANKNKDFSA